MNKYFFINSNTYKVIEKFQEIQEILEFKARKSKFLVLEIKPRQEMLFETRNLVLMKHYIRARFDFQIGKKAEREAREQKSTLTYVGFALLEAPDVPGGDSRRFRRLLHAVTVERPRQQRQLRR